MIMKNNLNFKGLVLNNVLTTSEMMLIKGGDNVSTNVLSDDKRRERPGGGISTCN
jgi:hypothetical protein